MNQMTIDNFEENQGVEEQIPANNKIQPNMSATIKRYRIIATIFTALLICVTLLYQRLISTANFYTMYIGGFPYGKYTTLIVAHILLFIPVLFSLLKISANKVTRDAVIIIFSTIIIQNLSYFISIFLPYDWLKEMINTYLPILYYITISYAVSIILRNNKFEEERIKETWIALFPLLWIDVYVPFFFVIFIPACFYIIYSSAFSGPSKEEVIISKPYAAVNRYTIASVIVCILTYAMPIAYNIITTHM